MSGGTQKEKQKLRNLLRKLRKDAGFRQVDLARRMGKPQSFVSKYELGEKNLDIFEVKEVCQALGIRLSEFVKLIDRRL